jgi:hypothetical protein
MITFDPIETELLEDGTVVPYKIVAASEGMTVNGNDKLILTLELTLDNGRKVLLFGQDLIFSAKAMWKIREFAISSALYPQFKAGKIGDVTVDKREGILEIGYDLNPGYNPKNFVKKWIESAEGLKQVEDFRTGKMKVVTTPVGNSAFDPNDPLSGNPF